MNDPVQAQVDAYNAHDVAAFLACYTDDVVVTDGTGTILMSGLNSMRSSYAEMFDTHPEVRAEILARQHAGTWTVDHERVSLGASALEVLVAYRVENGLIGRVVMLR